MAEQGIFPSQELLEDDDSHFPNVPLDMLEELERTFPNQQPDIAMSERQIWINVGKSQIVHFLREMHVRPSTIRKI